MLKRKLKILGSGCYLPPRIVRGEEIDQKLGLSPGSSERMSGVSSRRYVSDETNAQMGGYALMGALENCHLKFEDLDALIYASGSIQQAIPCTSALIQRELGKLNSGIPSFDINATCLSFVTALDVAGSLLVSNRFRRIGIVSSEIASVGLNSKQHEAYSLFGDGAAAVVVERTPENENSTILAARMATFSDGSGHCTIEGGGTLLHPSKFTGQNIPKERFLFHMEGRKVFRMALELLPEIYTSILKETGLQTSDFKLIIPHQASGSGMELVRRKLDIPSDIYMDILSEHGNMIAASIPLALHIAIRQNRIQRGDKVLLLGTSAGFSIGSIALIY